MANEKKSKVSILTNGIIKENPVLRLVLGTCSCLAVTTLFPAHWAWVRPSPSCWSAPTS